MNEFRNIVFEGGGVKGIAYAGAIRELEQLGILQKIKRVAGTSAGAITAILCALGYTAEEVQKILSETSFGEFKDDTIGVFRDTWRLFKHFGWHKGTKFEQWIGDIIAEKTGNPDCTFTQLKESNYADLFIVATNLSQQAAEIYSYETTPDMKIRAAVRASMSIPFFFQVVRKQHEVLVDGAVIWNYPINIFDDKKYVENEEHAEPVTYNTNPDYVFNHETLGFRLDDKKEIAYNKRNWATPPRKITNIITHTTALICFLLDVANKRHIHANDWNRTVVIDTLDVRTTDFNLPQEQIDALVEEGKKGVQQHFVWRNGKDGMTKP